MTPVKKLPRRGPGRTQVLALATATGTAAALLAYVGLARQTQGARAGAQTVPIVTATRDLPARTLLTGPMLRVRPVPVADAPAGAFHAPAAVVGLVTTAGISAGEALTPTAVATRGNTDGTAPQIAPDRRAVSIPLDAAGGAAGFLEPGDHVDVLATFDAGGGQAVARLVVPDARLLALGARPAGAGADGPATSATLEVTPRAAQALALASMRGRLTLALRGLGDDQATALPTLASAAVTGLPAPPAPKAPAAVPPPAPVTPMPTLHPLPTLAAPPPAPPQVTVVRGTQKTTVTVGE